MKVWMMTDLEGISGVNGRSNGIGNKIINEDVASRLLTEEVNAAVEGLVAGGAELVVVADGHGGSRMIQIEKLHPAASLLNFGADMAPVMPVDAGYDAAVHLGIHAMAGVRDGFLHHTFNSHSVINMWLNGQPVGEIAIQALCCAYHGVPTILVAGDHAACREARGFWERGDSGDQNGPEPLYGNQCQSGCCACRLRETARMALENKTRYPLKSIPLRHIN